MSVNRLVKLEAENVALQEEILLLKKKLTTANLSCSPIKAAGQSTDDSPQLIQMKNVISGLHEEVVRCFEELKKYRQKNVTVESTEVRVNDEIGSIKSAPQDISPKSISSRGLDSLQEDISPSGWGSSKPIVLPVTKRGAPSTTVVKDSVSAAETTKKSHDIFDLDELLK
jgi:hypothetical protein